MKKIFLLAALSVLLTGAYPQSPAGAQTNFSEYKVARLKKEMKIDGDWNKSEWAKIKPAAITNYMGEMPGFKPEAQAKMMYDNDNIYVIFRVKDKFVRCITNKINGPVWQDSAVEFFFAPDTDQPLLYFNLETNCGGTPLLHYNVVPRRESKKLPEEEIKQIVIAHSLPELTDPEIKEPVEWTLEYKIPLTLLEKYSKVTRPAKGVQWRANFYKIAENSSNPHYITWSKIDKPKPDFHVPQSFGILKFEK
jgi:hypothetical protein